MKSLPERPSLESLRKQAKRLARDVASGDSAAIARVRDQLPNLALPLNQRSAQLIVAREYGFAGWQDLILEVSKRVGKGLESAIRQARRAVHDNDTTFLRQLIQDFPALLKLRDKGGLLGFATESFGDSYDANREESFTRYECAVLLIDAGAVVVPEVYEGLLDSRTRRLLRLFEEKGLLPRTLRFRAALGEIDEVRALVEKGAQGLDEINEAFLRACHFGHEDVALFLLDQATRLDPRLGARIEKSGGRSEFVRYLMKERALTFSGADPREPWRAFLMEHVMRSIQDGLLDEFVGTLKREPWMLGAEYVRFQVGMIERATLRDRGEFIDALLDLHPALLRSDPKPAGQALLEIAFIYVKPHLLPVLSSIWPVPDDLVHAAGVGDLRRVTLWFTEPGEPALGDLADHYPANDPRILGHLHWDPPSVQQVLDTALAFAVMNSHFDVADFLLAHGADINTNWSSHEPASILHELVIQCDSPARRSRNLVAMKFLIDRGIDMTIKDYRWRSTAAGWARYAVQDEELARWLENEARSAFIRG